MATEPDLSEFEARWKKLDVTGWPVPNQVDYRLIGSALSRVRWEMDRDNRWERVRQAYDMLRALYDGGEHERLPTLLKRLKYLEDKLNVPSDHRIPDSAR